MLSKHNHQQHQFIYTSGGNHFSECDWSSGPLGDPPDSGSNQTSSASSEVDTAAGSTPVSALPWQVVVCGPSLKEVIVELLAQVQPCCNEICPSLGPVLSAQLTREQHRQTMEHNLQMSNTKKTLGQHEISH